MTLENRRIAAVTAIFCSILWGSAFPTLKVLYRVLAVSAVDVPTKWQLAGFRFFIAALMVGLVSSLVFKIDLKIRREDLGIFVALGLLQTFLQYTFFYVGVGNTSGIISAILTTSGTFFTVIVAHLFIPGDRLNRHKTLGILLGFAGILALNLGGDATFRPVFRLTGEGFLLGAGLTNAFAILLVRRLIRDYHPFVVNFYQLLIGSTLLILLGVITGRGIVPVNGAGLGLLFYGGFITSAAFSLWYALLMHHAAGEITIYKFVIPIAGSLLSALFLPGERFTPLIGISLVLTSIGMINLYLRGFLASLSHARR
jgi:drug/metabolite transporter (DMT)-like permease